MINSVGKRMSPSLVISCLALFIALGSAGYSATGGNFILGKSNSAGKSTALTSGVKTAPTLKITNSGNRPAASFNTKAGKPPFTVNRNTKVANLNADQLDGIDAVLFAEVAADGTLSNSSGGVTVTKFGAAGTGSYSVDFGRNVVQCTAVATIGPAATSSAEGQINVADSSASAEAVFVDTNDSDGAAADRPFRLLVVC